MAEGQIIERLTALRPELANIIGFHVLLDDTVPRPTPLQGMIYQAHLTAAAVKLAQEIMRIIEDEQTR